MATKSLRLCSIVSISQYGVALQSSPGNIVDVIWAAAVLDVRARAALSRLRELAALLELPQLDVSSQQRLFRAHMAFARSSENGSRGQGIPLLPPEMLSLTKAAWQDKLTSILVSQVSYACSCLSTQVPCP